MFVAEKFIPPSQVDGKMRCTFTTFYRYLLQCIYIMQISRIILSILQILKCDTSSFEYHNFAAKSQTSNTKQNIYVQISNETESFRRVPSYRFI